MKKIIPLLFLFVSFTCYAAFSQANAGKSSDTKYIFCELVQQDVYTMNETRTTAFLNFGSKSNYQNRVEESNYVRAQKVGLDALNYMSQNGWELVCKNMREAGSYTIEIVYLLKKKDS